MLNDSQKQLPLRVHCWRHSLQKGCNNCGYVSLPCSSTIAVNLQEISNEYWCFPGLNPEGSDEMTKESYLKLNRKLHLALVCCGCGCGCGRSWGLPWMLPSLSAGSHHFHHNRFLCCRSSRKVVTACLRTTHSRVCCTFDYIPAK